MSCLCDQPLGQLTVPAPSVGPPAVSVSLLKWKYDYVDAGAVVLDRFVDANQGLLGQLVMTQWKRWRAAWLAFYVDTRSWAVASVTDWMALDLWEKDLVGWYEYVRRIAGSAPRYVASDEAPRPDGVAPNLLEKLSFPLGVLAGAFVLTKVL